MSEAAQSVLNQALSLSEEDRGELVDTLIRSFSAPPGWVEMNEEEFQAELERRAKECEDGTDPGIPWPEVKAMLLSEINAHAKR
jgi:putative addiction module component (TIGR02574 family)